VKHARLLWTALAVVVVAGTAALALASGMASKQAAARSGACPATTACPTGSAQCTTAQMAACAASGKTAAADCPMHGAKGAKSGCTMGAAQGATSGTSAAAASSSCCAPGAKSSTGAAAAGAGCGSHASMAAMDCDACADMASCEADIAEAGGKVQIVPLKNGLMYVYSAESSAKVRAVQSAVARHAERLAMLSASNDKSKLCASCREMRGAAASGKLTREIVNIESGCLTLVTSNDPQVVTRLYALAGLASGTARAATTKS
jgi:hypothetical protein